MKILTLMGCSLMSGSLAGCSLSDLTKGDQAQEDRIVDRDIAESLDGARGAYHAAVGKFALALSRASFSVGQFSDELSVPSGTAKPDAIYLRRLRAEDSPNEPAYYDIHVARINAQQAADLLRRFGGEQGKSMLAHAYAIRAYTIVLLGELYCSGIPLTSVPYGGTLEYTPGRTTREIFEHALAVLDTASQIETDSLPVLTTLRVVRGRALLNLGRFSEAAAAVTQVATTDRATLSYVNTGANIGVADFWTRVQANYTKNVVANAKGSNGLRWLANAAINQDPRVPVSRTTNGQQFQSPIRQQKFMQAALTVVAADGIEARLIEAEALLQPANAPSGNWLGVLNTLRRTAVPAGRVLADTTDPGTAQGRIDLLFRERAFWFYLTAHRLGDMRRLIRQYGRSPQIVFPVGFPPGANLTFGEEYVLTPEPLGKEIELETNPYYGGCFDGNP